MSFEVEQFTYNGFMVSTNNKKLIKTNYTADFIKWTEDPGIAECQCSDGKIRYIPSCCLIGNKESLPKQTYKHKILFGTPTTS